MLKVGKLKVEREKVKVGRSLSLVAFVFAGCLALQAQDAQWRGPGRNGIFADTLLLKEWPESGPDDRGQHQIHDRWIEISGRQFGRTHIYYNGQFRRNVGRYP